MERTLQEFSWVKGRSAHTILARGIGWGVIGGLAGTLIMDLFLMGALFMAGIPALTCFSIVGNTMARFFTILGLPMTGGVLLGATVHYLVGPMFGAIFGAVITHVKAFQVNTLKKSITLAVVYVEILGQPMLAMSPILMKMTASETLQWYGGSFAMHLIWGVVLGVTMNLGLGLAAAKPIASQDEIIPI